MKRVVPRNRRIPGRAVGFLFFVLRWESGVSRQDLYEGRRRLDVMIRLFRDRLHMVPPEELPHATAEFYAAVRKASGGMKRVTLASWVGSEPIEPFFTSARAAWIALPKERDDQKKEIPLEEPDAFFESTDVKPE